MLQKNKEKKEKKNKKSHGEVLLLTNFAVGPWLRTHEGPILDRCIIFQLMNSNALSPCCDLIPFLQGVMFFASGFDRVSDGATYEIHYKASG